MIAKHLEPRPLRRREEVEAVVRDLDPFRTPSEQTFEGGIESGLELLGRTGRRLRELLSVDPQVVALPEHLGNLEF